MTHAEALETLKADVPYIGCTGELRVTHRTPHATRYRCAGCAAALTVSGDRVRVDYRGTVEKLARTLQARRALPPETDPVLAEVWADPLAVGFPAPE